VPRDSVRLRKGAAADLRVDRAAVLETPFGAYARRQLRRRTRLGLFGVVLIVAATLLYWQLRPGTEQGGGRYPVVVRCISCGYEQTLTVPLSQSDPLVCPNCGERSLRPLWRCRDCGRIFQPKDTIRPTRCPQCGSQRVGSAAATP